MSAREYVWIVKEKALGVVMDAPVPGTDSVYIRLSGGNAFSMYTKPVTQEIMHGGGFAVAAEAISDHYSCTGSLKTMLYPSQAELLMGLLMGRLNSDQTLPWPSTEPAGDLPSVSIYHAVRRSDGSYKRRRYAGVKAGGGTIDVSRDGTSATISLDLVACRAYGNTLDGTNDPDSTEFPAPTEDQYPTGPYTFRSTAGLLTIGGAVRTQYSSLSIKFQNALDPQWFENAHLSVLQFCGRATTLDANLFLKPTPDDRATYEALTTAQDVSVGFSQGNDSLTIDFHGRNYISDLPYDLPLDKVYMLKASWKNLFDPSAGEDVIAVIDGDLSLGLQ